MIKQINAVVREKPQGVIRGKPRIEHVENHVAQHSGQRLLLHPDR